MYKIDLVLPELGFATAGCSTFVEHDKIAEQVLAHLPLTKIGQQIIITRDDFLIDEEAHGSDNR